LYNRPARTKQYARCIRWAHAWAVMTVPMTICKLRQGVMLLNASQLTCWLCARRTTVSSSATKAAVRLAVVQYFSLTTPRRNQSLWLMTENLFIEPQQQLVLEAKWPLDKGPSDNDNDNNIDNNPQTCCCTGSSRMKHHMRCTSCSQGGYLVFT